MPDIITLDGNRHPIATEADQIARRLELQLQASATALKFESAKFCVMAGLDKKEFQAEKPYKLAVSFLAKVLED